MKQLIAIALLLVLGAVTVAAQENQSKQTKKSGKQKTEMTSSADAKSIDVLRKSYQDAYNAKDAAKVADLYTDDANMATPGGTAQGKEQIRSALQKGIDAGETIVAITPTRTDVKGDLGFEDGTFQQKMGDKEINGNYLVVMKKVAGQWKLAAHNSVVPTPTQPAKETKE